MNYYNKTSEQTLTELKTSENGLSVAESEKRLAENGKNKLTEAKKTSNFKRFLNQLADPMIIILLVAAALSGITSAYAGESFADVFIIIAVVLINSTLGVVQESKAEKAIEALKEMTAATCKVIRDGKIIHIKTEDTVVGDIVVLEAGDSVPADCRIIECASLKIDESALTGESVPVTKDASPISSEQVSLGDRSNMAYMSCNVVYGRGKAVITTTGMDTEVGNIADAISKAQDEKTPLQIKLGQLSAVLTYVVLGICAVILAIGLIREGTFTFKGVLTSLMPAISLAVAAIPEGLAAVVTIVLSMGVTRMSKHNAVIRKMTAVETLGCTQIICSDKTGTLTQNRMTVVESTGCDKNLLAEGMALCSDADTNADFENATGEPTECALVNFATSIGILKSKLKTEYPRVGEAPFDSLRKMMSTVHSCKDGFVQYTKGAPDEVLKICTKILTPDGIKPLDEQARAKLLSENKAMADKALRVLACAYKTYEEKPENFEDKTLETDMCFVGMTGMIDPIRPEVADAVTECRTAGIRAVMITGDHRDTAAAIAKQLGIIDDESQAISGSALDNMSDEELCENIEKYSVYARVQPEHKVRIVRAWKAHGKIVAMTGDGVNDAPSIKTADIGVGMGITGTDVTKNVADMVLADDNFATIVSAVEEGRKIYSNIRKAIQFLLSSNLSEIISVFTATMLSFTILKPVHLLWINLITDSLPALALGIEPGEDDSMRKPPRNPKEGIFSNGVGYDILYQGILVSVLTLAAYFIGHFMEAGKWEITESADGMTMAFLTMSMAEIFQSFNMRSRRGSVFTLKKQNIYLWGAAALALLLTSAVIYVPFLAKAFQFEHINLAEYFTALGLAFLIIPSVEFIKLIQRAIAKKKNRVVE